MGRVKRGRGTLLGNAGEHFVLAELLRRDIVAGLTPRNAPGIDILADVGGRSLRIRVKTKSPEARSWVWMAKAEDADGLIFPGLQEGDKDDLTALVEIPDKGGPEIYLIPTSAVDALIKQRHREWLATPGKRGQPHNPSRMRRLIVGPDLEALRAKHSISWDDLKHG